MGDTPRERLEHVMRKDFMDDVSEQTQKRLQTRGKGIKDGDTDVRLLQGTDSFVMKFEECVFQNNSQGDYGDHEPTYGVVSILSAGNVVIFKDCIFAMNVYNGVSGVSGDR